MKRTTFTILISALVFTLTTGASNNERREISPHAIALALILEKQAARIAGVEPDGDSRWFDTSVREWHVQRPWAPGVTNTTEFFTVTYLIDGKKSASWNVNTKRMTFASEGESLQID